MRKILLHGKDSGHITALISVFFVVIFALLLGFSNLVQKQFEKIEREQKNFITSLEISNSKERIFYEDY